MKYLTNIQSQEQMAKKFLRALNELDNVRTLAAINELGDAVNTRHPAAERGTLLHAVVQVGTAQTEQYLLPIIYQLSNAGVDVNAVDARGRTALELAIDAECPAIVAALIRVGVDPTERDYRQLIDERGGRRRGELLHAFDTLEPGLWAAVARGNVPTVLLLVNSWCRVRISRTTTGRRQNAGSISLEQAAAGSRSANAAEIRRILTDLALTIELVHATMAGDRQLMIQWLASGSVDPNIMDISYQSHWRAEPEPRSLRAAAEALGHHHVLDLLPDDENVDGTNDRSRDVIGYYDDTQFSLDYKRQETNNDVDDDDDVTDGNNTYRSVTFEQESGIYSNGNESARSAVNNTTRNGHRAGHSDYTSDSVTKPKTQLRRKRRKVSFRKDAKSAMCVIS